MYYSSVTYFVQVGSLRQVPAPRPWLNPRFVRGLQGWLPAAVADFENSGRSLQLWRSAPNTLGKLMSTTGVVTERYSTRKPAGHRYRKAHINYYVPF